MNLRAGFIKDAGEELARRYAIDRFEREDGPNIRQARKHFVPGDLRAALAAEQIGNVVLTKSPSPTFGSQIIVEVVLGHGRKSNGNPVRGCALIMEPRRCGQKTEKRAGDGTFYGELPLFAK